MKTKWYKIAGLIVLCALIFVYFCVMIFNANINVDSIVDTAYATKITYNETLDVRGIVIRDESLISYSTDKVLFYTVDDGDTVKANSPVAFVFGEEDDALAYKQVNELNEQIETLEELNSSKTNHSADYSVIDKQIQHNIKNIIMSANDSNFSSVNYYSDELKEEINERQIVTGEVSNFDEQINMLIEERNHCLDVSADYEDVVYSQSPGYFVSSADGFEYVYNYDSIKDFTVDNFSFDKTAENVPIDTVGKIISGPNWYVVCRLSSDEALNLSHSDVSLSLSFPDSSCYDIPADLVALNQANKTSDAIAVFSCNYMNSTISHLRDENVSIKVNSYSGLRIEKSAIHYDYVDVKDSDTGEKKKVEGVYVLRGNELVFKEISILPASVSEFVIIDDNQNSEKLVSGSTVSLNDSVVVKGEDLYAGKIVK